MSKIYTTCVNCGSQFYRSPSFHTNAIKRGSEVKFCSRACTDEARSKKLIGTKLRRGKQLTCEICSTEFYRPASMINDGKCRFCSEPCRLEAHKRRLVDRSQPRPNRKVGETISCLICGKDTYRKQSMIDRNINKTCGDIACISAYSRSLWRLPPRTPAELSKPRPKRKYRTNNFTAKQRKDWLDSKCARCGATENLALDHIVAACRNGPNARDNAQTLCQPCNNWKAKNIDRLVD